MGGTNCCLLIITNHTGSVCEPVPNPFRTNLLVFTLARIYMNAEKRRLYSKAFQMLFSFIGKINNQPLKWRHLHETGMIGVTVDMDGKQMGGELHHVLMSFRANSQGFGRYLRSIDHLHRNWRWQIQCTTKFCEAHFNRSITRATKGIEETSTSVHHRMKALLTARSWAEWDEICGLLIGKHNHTCSTTRC